MKACAVCGHTPSYAEVTGGESLCAAHYGIAAMMRGLSADGFDPQEAFRIATATMTQACADAVLDFGADLMSAKSEPPSQTN